MINDSGAFEGRTFTSSERGLRSEYWHFLSFGLSILVGALASSLVRNGEIDWRVLIVFPVTCALVTYLLRGSLRRRVFRSTVTLDADFVDVVEEGKSTRIPLQAIAAIRIERSASGHRRQVHLKSRGGRSVVLLDPEGGGQLELWAREVAQAAGVKVLVNIRWWMHREQWWMFLLLCAVTVSTSVVFAFMFPRVPG